MNIEDYLDTVAQAFDNNIKESIQDMKSDLTKAGVSKNIPADKIEAACNRLLHKIKPIIDKNLSKFSLYAVRNIFKETIDSINAAEMSAIKSSHIATPSSSSSASAELDAEEAQLDQTLESLKRDYLNRYQEYSRIVAECQDMDALIKDMRETSFSVRLRIQEMDRIMDQQSLAETTKAMSDLAARLQDCCSEAEALIRKMNAAQNIPEEEERPNFGEDSVARPDESLAIIDSNTTTASINISSATNSQNVRTGSASAVLRVAQSLQSQGGRK